MVALFGTSCDSRRDRSVERRDRSSDCERAGSAISCARSYVVPIAFASAKPAARRASYRPTARLRPKPRINPTDRGRGLEDADRLAQDVGVPPQVAADGGADEARADDDREDEERDRPARQREEHGATPRDPRPCRALRQRIWFRTTH